MLVGGVPKPKKNMATRNWIVTWYQHLTVRQIASWCQVEARQKPESGNHCWDLRFNFSVLSNQHSQLRILHFVTVQCSFCSVSWKRTLKLNVTDQNNNKYRLVRKWAYRLGSCRSLSSRLSTSIRSMLLGSVSLQRVSTLDT